MLDNLVKQLWRKRASGPQPIDGVRTIDALHDFEAGLSLQKNGQFKEAESIYRKILLNQPQNPDAMHLLGHVLNLQCDYAGAADVLKRLVVLSPGLADVHLSLGIVLRAQGKLTEALESFDNALRIRPSFAGALLHSAYVLTDLGQTDRAEDAYRKLTAVKPELVVAHLNLGVNLLSQGRLDEGVASYRKALEVNPDSVSVHTNLVYALNFHPGYSPEQIFQEHRSWAERHAEPLKELYPKPDNDRSSDRCLRVGYVSPDFRNHSVCYFFEPLLEHHDRTRFEIFCYSDVKKPDEYTSRLQNYRVHWRQATGLSDDELFHAIRQDKIDILVDLAGHTKGNRLLTFARKPAPVQVTGIGYINTTGMSAMDYRLTDAYVDPPGLTEHCYSEQLARLPRIYMAFRPPITAPAVNPLPSSICGNITFASYSGLFKISPDDFTVWADILRAVPGSRLKILASSPGKTSEKLRQVFVQLDIDPERIEFVPAMSYQKYLLTHHDIDIVLDTFPCNGVTTTCHSLWMGVPVIVRAGDYRCVSRAGASILANMGLESLIARSVREYRDIAVALATDTDRLKCLRASLRETMAKSPNTDGGAYTSDLENIYRKMWCEWCRSAPAQ